jgi:hypothetical protein
MHTEQRHPNWFENYCSNLSHSFDIIFNRDHLTLDWTVHITVVIKSLKMISTVHYRSDDSYTILCKIVLKCIV